MKSLLRLFKYPLQYKLNVFIGLFAMLIQTTVGFVVPLLMIDIIDVAIPSNDMALLTRTGLLMIGVAFIGLLMGYINTYNSQKVAVFATADLRETLFAKIQRLSFRNIDDLKTSRLITTSTNDVVRMQQFFQMLLRIIVRAPLMVGIGLFMALTTSVRLSNVFLVSIPLLIISIIVIMLLAFPLFSKVQKTVDDLNKVSLETTKSPRVIKSFVTMDFENDRFTKVNTAYRDINTAAERILAAAEPIMIFIFTSTLAGILFLGAYYFNQGYLINIIEGESLPAVGIMVAFNNYSMQILFGLLMFAMMMIFISRAIVSANRITEVLDTEIDLKDQPKSLSNHALKGKITFENVTFGYGHNGNHVLDNISFTINPGETVGIIGSTGSGKSSLIQLIPRLYDVTSGTVYIDDIDVKDIKLDTLRSQISVVTQKATVFSGSVATNMLQGKKEASFDDLENASKQANAYEFISEYNDYFNHRVEQEGANLSGGQKQRLSLARAFIKKPQILILDDSTSAVDAKSEAEILHAIDRLSDNMTTLVIAQKISTIKDMDKILVLDNKGHIDGYDTHEQLLKTSTVYQEIALSQIGGDNNVK
ncbi:MAG: ABC transporter ATP-binding protein [Candidatus Izemoplasma sp.]|nr:ABC transporter ATP-binding protein [Candidatus Izemoplasma sp.]